MAKKKGRKNQRLVVSLQPVATPDADARLRRAIELLLQTATARVKDSTSQNEKERIKGRGGLPG